MKTPSGAGGVRDRRGRVAEERVASLGEEETHDGRAQKTQADDGAITKRTACWPAKQCARHETKATKATSTDAANNHTL